MSNQSFSTIIQGTTPVLIDFFAEWCGPCKAMKPILEDLKSRMGERIKIIKIDVDKNQPLASKYQIQGVPTLMVFKEGKSVWRQSGVVGSSDLEKILNRL
jgi:thioredoxin 1